MTEIDYEGIESTAHKEKADVIDSVDHIEVVNVEGWTADMKLEINDNLLTGEEGEETLYENLAKLYRWRDADWRERGKGRAKIMKAPDGKVRFLMRQEKTMKIIANHILNNTNNLCNLTMNAGNDKCWVWMAADCAEENTTVEQFAIRFGTTEKATCFKTSFEEGCNCNNELLKLRPVSETTDISPPEKCLHSPVVITALDETTIQLNAEYRSEKAPVYVIETTP